VQQRRRRSLPKVQTQHAEAVLHHRLDLVSLPFDQEHRERLMPMRKIKLSAKATMVASTSGEPTMGCSRASMTREAMICTPLIMTKVAGKMRKANRPSYPARPRRGVVLRE
jgi:hypothetical protein